MVLERLDLQQEGTLRQAMRLSDRYSDQVVYSGRQLQTGRADDLAGAPHQRIWRSSTPARRPCHAVAGRERCALRGEMWCRIHARSPNERPMPRVTGRRRAASAASAMVKGSTAIAPSSRPRSISSSHSCAGSPPRSATRLRTSARLTVEMTVPCAIASATTSAPGSLRRYASSAEASRTAWGTYSRSSRAAASRRSANSSSTNDSPAGARAASMPRL